MTAGLQTLSANALFNGSLHPVYTKTHIFLTYQWVCCHAGTIVLVLFSWVLRYLSQISSPNQPDMNGTWLVILTALKNYI